VVKLRERRCLAKSFNTRGKIIDIETKEIWAARSPLFEAPGKVKGLRDA
jgi:hypothetical protein